MPGPFTYAQPWRAHQNRNERGILIGGSCCDSWIFPLQRTHAVLNITPLPGCTGPSPGSFAVFATVLDSCTRAAAFSLPTLAEAGGGEGNGFSALNHPLSLGLGARVHSSTSQHRPLLPTCTLLPALHIPVFMMALVR